VPSGTKPERNAAAEPQMEARRTATQWLRERGRQTGNLQVYFAA